MISDQTMILCLRFETFSEKLNHQTGNKVIFKDIEYDSN